MGDGDGRWVIGKSASASKARRFPIAHRLTAGALALRRLELERERVLVGARRVRRRPSCVAQIVNWWCSGMMPRSSIAMRRRLAAASRSRLASSTCCERLLDARSRPSGCCSGPSSTRPRPLSRRTSRERAQRRARPRRSMRPSRPCAKLNSASTRGPSKAPSARSRPSRRCRRASASARPPGTICLVVDVAVVRSVDRQVEAVGIAGLGEQLLRALGVVGAPAFMPGTLPNSFAATRAGRPASRGLPSRARRSPARLIALLIAWRTRSIDEGILRERLAVLVGDERRSLAELVEVEVDDRDARSSR